MKTNPTTIAEYLSAIPDDRRTAIKKLRALMRKHLPKGYEEAFEWGMIAYQVPLSAYPDTYNKKPLLYAALASQKNYMAIYLSNVYGSPALRRRLEATFSATGKRLDMGASCVRFRRIEDIPLEAIAHAVAGTPMRDFIAHANKVHANK